MKEEIRITFDNSETPIRVVREALSIANRSNDDAIFYGEMYKLKLCVGKRIKTVEIKLIPIEDREPKKSFIKRIINFWTK